MKTCTKCKVEKPLSGFSTDNSKRDCKHSQCKACHILRNTEYRKNPAVLERSRQSSREYREKYPERTKAIVRNATLKKKYGITTEGFNTLLREQGGVCAICGSSESRGNGEMHVDHDHTTGDIRGILCQACNVTLGKMRDDPRLLRKAADYLENRVSKG